MSETFNGQQIHRVAPIPAPARIQRVLFTIPFILLTPKLIPLCMPHGALISKEAAMLPLESQYNVATHPAISFPYRRLGNRSRESENAALPLPQRDEITVHEAKRK